ncbi:MAG TPA: glycerol-3-phosphate responsive antiterminator [Lachnospiraceae bacterium]|nr:glycerol-3-phosphate responsive antiterminator [Lachnospiraceae bacterium]
MGREFVEAIEAAPIVAAVKDYQGLEKCLTSDVDAVFILYGDICTIADIVARIKDAGKIAMVHMDLITGLSPKDVSTDFIRKYTRADGIITTKGNLISHAKEIGLATVLRYFVLDSMALINIERQSHQSRESQPDIIEILPGIVVPKMVRKICAMSRVPVICGGLIQDREDVMNALSAGACAISTTSSKVWFM